MNVKMGGTGTYKIHIKHPLENKYANNVLHSTVLKQHPQNVLL